MLIEAIGLSLIVAIIRRGDIGLLGKLDLRRAWLIFVPAALIATLYTKYIPGMEFMGRLTLPVHIVAYLIALTAIWSNRHLPFMLLIGFGAALNFTVIAVNDGRMPVSVKAKNMTGLQNPLSSEQNARHAPIDGSTKLAFLADTIPITRPPFPFPGVISVGDIVLSVGLFILIQRATCLPKLRNG